uniref:Glutaredoxin 5 n=1 Tax=Cyanistes caeruleus TaxID=156563 RepID=A0A8C0VBE8_CYACU
RHSPEVLEGPQGEAEHNSGRPARPPRRAAQPSPRPSEAAGAGAGGEARPVHAGDVAGPDRSSSTHACGNAVVQILRLHGVEDYRAHDVLQDPDLRQGIKNYSNWPTIPQVYLNGEFVGGCDILLQMHQNGDLVEELKKLGIRSALLDAEKDQEKK